MAGNALSFNNALGEILKFSLIHRDMPTKTLDIHRLVQSVILKSLDGETRNQWIERFVRTMNRLLPDVKFETWPLYDRLLTQAQQCASFISQENLMLLEGARILNQTAYYLYERARYSEAEPHYQRALTIRELALGSIHPHVAVLLNNLGLLNHHQGKYSMAETFYIRALDIREREPDGNQPTLAQSLNNLAAIYDTQNKHDRAEPLFQRALVIFERVLRKGSPRSRHVPQQSGNAPSSPREKHRSQAASSPRTSNQHNGS